MNAISRQSDTCSRICQDLAGIALSLLLSVVIAGEAAVDPKSIGRMKAFYLEGGIYRGTV